VGHSQKVCERRGAQENQQPLLIRNLWYHALHGSLQCSWLTAIGQMLTQLSVNECSGRRSHSSGGWFRSGSSK
jgi:hypothetical protein